MITSDPEIMSGQWCFDGTRIPVSCVIEKRGVGYGWGWVKENYPTVTHDQYEAALGWDFPPVPGMEPSLGCTNIFDEVNCVCGQSAEPDGDAYVCVFCGREWQVTITVKPSASDCGTITTPSGLRA